MMALDERNLYSAQRTAKLAKPTRVTASRIIAVGLTESLQALRNRHKRTDRLASRALRISRIPRDLFAARPAFPRAVACEFAAGLLAPKRPPRESPAEV